MCYHALAYLHVQYYVWELSNEVLYDILSQGASKLPQLEELDFPFYLTTTAFFGASKKYDATKVKMSYSVLFESS